MSVYDQISVRTQYTRSVNLERDAEVESVINGYIPTSRAIDTMQRVVSAFTDERCPRAWSLTGSIWLRQILFCCFSFPFVRQP